MNNKRISELDKLFTEIGTYRDSNDFKNLFDFIKKFPYIAPYNAMLIHIQKPGSQFVASVTEWGRHYHRTIKPGARPLVILRPFGPVAFVFEYGDTEGEDFPEEVINPFYVEGTISDEKFDNLITNLRSDGIQYVEADHGTSSAGVIRKSDSKELQTVLRDDKEIRVKILYTLVVNKNHSTETKLATIAHELGHLYCGHLGSPNPKWWSDSRPVSLKAKEFEAESICWLVCERLGIKNPSVEYLSGYLKDNKEIPDISIDAVLKSVLMIEQLIQATKEPRKELIVA